MRKGGRLWRVALARASCASPIHGVLDVEWRPPGVHPLDGNIEPGQPADLRHQPLEGLGRRLARRRSGAAATTWRRGVRSLRLEPGRRSRRRRPRRVGTRVASAIEVDRRGGRPRSGDVRPRPLLPPGRADGLRARRGRQVARPHTGLRTVRPYARAGCRDGNPDQEGLRRDCGEADHAHDGLRRQ